MTDSAKPLARLGRMGSYAGGVSLGFLVTQGPEHKVGDAVYSHKDYDALKAKCAALETQCAELKEHADMYRYLRAQHWSDGDIAVVLQPKEAVKLGRTCPSGEKLDTVIRNMMAQGVGRKP